MTRFNITPKIITTTIHSIEIESGKIKLGKSAKFPVKYYDKDGKLLEIRNVEITGEDYANWGNDDSIIYDKVLKVLKIDKVPMESRKLVILAKSLIVGQGDGRLSKDNVMQLFKSIKKDSKYSFFEKETIKYISENFNWTDAAKRLWTEKVNEFFN